MLEIKHIVHQSETTLCIYFGDVIETELALEIAQFTELLRSQMNDLTEVIPSYTSLFIEFHILKTDARLLEKEIRELLSAFQYKHLENNHLELPIYYHPDVAPDLIDLADKNNLTIDQVVQIHSQTTYRVTSLGFAPGFAYLAGLDPRLATPRLQTPKNVAKGSLGIADHQTAIYPNASPGGWSIIGNCPASLYDLKLDPITPFKIGMTVNFKSITKEVFLEKGGII